MAKRALTLLSTKQILAEIERRKKKLGGLTAKRNALAKQLAKLDSEIASLGGAATPVAPAGKAGKKTRGRPRKAGSGKRPKNTESLPEAMTKVMSKSTPMSADEISAAVTANGYKTKSANFKTIIFQTLGREKKLFEKASRGRYVLK